MPPRPICAWPIGIRMVWAPDDEAPWSIGIAWPPDAIEPCLIGMVMPGIGIAGAFVLDRIFFAAPFFLAAVFFFVAAFFFVGRFVVGFFSDIGMVMPGICIGCAIAGAVTAPSATALAAANKIIFTKFLR